MASSTLRGFLAKPFTPLAEALALIQHASATAKVLGREMWVLISGCLALASGVAQLVVSGPGRLALLLLFASSLVFALVRTVQLVVSRQIRGLQAEVTGLRETVAAITDNTRSSFREQVTLTYQIGGQPSHDAVIEVRETSPVAEVLWRKVGLTVSTELTKTPKLDAIDASSWCTSPPDTQVNLVPLEQTPGHLRVLAIFWPPIQRPTQWGMKYHPEGGLWNPLRATGRDELVYTTASYLDRRDEVELSSLTLDFIFPPHVADATIREQDDRGLVSTFVDGERMRISWTISPVPSTFFSFLIVVPAWNRIRSSS